MRILVACEYSGIVRDAFIAKGHDAISCDLLDTESYGPHYTGNVLDILNNEWDLMIAHPPCTYLTTAANKWHKKEYKTRFPTRETDRINAINFFIILAQANIHRIAIENPIGIMSSKYMRPSQIIHPYYFGSTERKATCLWLKNLPLLQYRLDDDLFGKKTSTAPVIITHKSGRTDSLIHYETLGLPSRERSKIRSKTFPGIAKAMADQWGKL